VRFVEAVMTVPSDSPEEPSAVSSGSPEFLPCPGWMTGGARVSALASPSGCLAGRLGLEPVKAFRFCSFILITDSGAVCKMHN
jgi:hypothetical protein